MSRHIARRFAEGVIILAFAGMALNACNAAYADGMPPLRFDPGEPPPLPPRVEPGADRIYPMAKLHMAERLASSIRTPEEVGSWLVSYLGPLPWRFNRDGPNPFGDPLIIERIQLRRTDTYRGSELMTWIGGRYLMKDGGWYSHSRGIGPAVTARKEGAIYDPPEDIYRPSARPVDRDISGYPRALGPW